MNGLNLNVEITSADEIEEVVEELMQKEEFICTGDVCVAHACAIYSV